MRKRAVLAIVAAPNWVVSSFVASVPRPWHASVWSPRKSHHHQVWALARVGRRHGALLRAADASAAATARDFNSQEVVRSLRFGAGADGTWSALDLMHFVSITVEQCAWDPSRRGKHALQSTSTPLAHRR